MNINRNIFFIQTQSLAASTVSLMRFLDQEKAKMAKKAAAANTDLAEEIVQYTDLEAEFVLTGNQWIFELKRIINTFLSII